MFILNFSSPVAGASGVSVPVIPDPVSRGVSGVGGVGVCLVRVLFPGPLGACARAPSVVAPQQVLRLPIRRA